VRSAMPASRHRTSRMAWMPYWASAGKGRKSSWRKRAWRAAGMPRHRRMRHWMPACVLPLCTKRVHSSNVVVASWICSAVGDMQNLLSRPLVDVRERGGAPASSALRHGIGGMFAQRASKGIPFRSVRRRSVQQCIDIRKLWKIPLPPP
jgi:hypothetical protein